jgi:hypothetical protein
MKRNLLRLLCSMLLISSTLCLVAQKIQHPEIQKHNQMNGKQLLAAEQTKFENRAILTEYDSTYDWTWDTTRIPEWKLAGKMINMVYDANSNLIENLHQSWTNSSWINDYKENKTFAGRRFIEQTKEVWNGNAWVKNLKLTDSYDSNGNVTKAVGQIGKGADWEDEYAVLMTYDVHNNNTELIFQLWKNSSWQNAAKHLRTYDTDNNLTKDTEMKWNDSIWVNWSQGLYTFKKNKLRSYTFQSWKKSTWEDNLLVTFIYDNNDSLTDIIDQVWRNGSLENSSKQTYFKDDIINYFWDKTTWIKVSDEIYLHDSKGNITDRTFKSYFFEDNNNKIYYGDSTHFFIKNIPNGIVKNEISDKVLLYPNPSPGKFTVKLENNHSIKMLEIYNSVGAKIVEQTSGEVTINEVTKGMYMLKIYDEEKVYCKKIMLE